MSGGNPYHDGLGKFSTGTGAKAPHFGKRVGGPPALTKHDAKQAMKNVAHRSRIAKQRSVPDTVQGNKQVARQRDANINAGKY